MHLIGRMSSLLGGTERVLSSWWVGKCPVFLEGGIIHMSSWRDGTCCLLGRDGACPIFPERVISPVSSWRDIPTVSSWKEGTCLLGGTKPVPSSWRESYPLCLPGGAAHVFFKWRSLFRLPGESHTHCVFLEGRHVSFLLQEGINLISSWRDSKFPICFSGRIVYTGIGIYPVSSWRDDICPSSVRFTLRRKHAHTHTQIKQY